MTIPKEAQAREEMTLRELCQALDISRRTVQGNVNEYSRELLISNFAVKCFYAKLVNIIKRTVKK